MSLVRNLSGQQHDEGRKLGRPPARWHPWQNTMKLVILGKYSPYPPPGGACSGYLVQHRGRTLLLDCGNGCVAAMQDHIDFDDLDWIVLSHLHPDHISDLFILRYALSLGPNAGQPVRVRVFAPDEPAEEFCRLQHKQVLVSEKVSAEQRLNLGPFSVTFAPGQHAIPSLAMRITSDSGTLAYTGDTAPCRRVEHLARDADLLLSEATHLRPPDDEQRRHMTAAEAGMLAEKAAVNRLLLTHIWPHHCEEELVRAAQSSTSIPVEMARQGQEYLI